MHLRLGVGVEEQEGPEESPRCSEPPSVHTELTYPWTSVISRTGGGARDPQEQASSVESRHPTQSGSLSCLGGD